MAKYLDETGLRHFWEKLKYKFNEKNVAECSLNSIGEYYTDLALNGCCYIGNSQIVYYCASGTSNTGELICFNIETYQEVWRHSIELYHGNTISYNSKTNSIYVVPCFSMPDRGDYFNTLLEIDLSNPSVVSRTITLDGTVYGGVYDNETEKFYCITTDGTVEGSSNRVDVYNSDFTFDRSFVLKQFATNKYNISNQGVGLVHNGLLYVPFYEPDAEIGVWDLNGNLINTFRCPPHANGYRNIYEIESMYYDFDRDVIGISFTSNNQNHTMSITFADTSILSGIFVNDFVKDGLSRARIDVSVNTDDPTDYRPTHITRVFKTISDVSTLQAYHDGVVVAYLSGAAVNGAVNINNPKGLYLIKSSSASSFLFNGAVTITGGKITFQDLSFAGSITQSGTTSNILLNNADAVVSNCSFSNSSSVYAVQSYRGSVLNLQGGGTFADDSMKAIATYQGSVYCDHGSGRYAKGIVCGGTGANITKVFLYDGIIAPGQTYPFVTKLNWNGVSDVEICFKAQSHSGILNDVRSSSQARFSLAWDYQGSCIITYGKITINKSANTFTVDNIYQSTNFAAPSQRDADVTIYALTL